MAGKETEDWELLARVEWQDVKPTRAARALYFIYGLLLVLIPSCESKPPAPAPARNFPPPSLSNQSINHSRVRCVVLCSCVPWDR
jgi:hypothetical protein